MCGIAGWNLKDKPDATFVLSLAFHMEERGKQSFGMYDGEAAQIERGLGKITDRLPASALQFTHGFLHTRHATTGALTASNSHPFKIGEIVGAHNGMIYNHKEMQDKYNRSFPVDSQHIFAHISEGLPLAELEGYGAIEYAKDGKYFIAACNDGDLECAILSNGAGVVWASTQTAIASAVLHSGLTVEGYYKIEPSKVYEVRVSGLFETDSRFDLADLMINFNSDWQRALTRGQDLRTTTSDTRIDREFRRKNRKRKKQRDSTDVQRGAQTFTYPPDLSDVKADSVDLSDLETEDLCHWCANYKPVRMRADGTLACAECDEGLEYWESGSDTVDISGDDFNRALEEMYEKYERGHNDKLSFD